MAFNGAVPTSLKLAALALCAAPCAGAFDASVADSATVALTEVIITGSRIPAEPTAGTIPVTVLGADDIRRGGPDSLGRVLQALPFNAGAQSNANDNDGDGSERINLRGLGPNRTLVLLNGRRFPNGGLGGDDSVDLSMLPLSMIDRVEVLTSGASATYGADAIGGVVNVITRPPGSGVSVLVKDTIASRGDGRIRAAQFAAGRSIASGAWTFGADFVDQVPVTYAHRGYSSLPTPIVAVDGTRQTGGTKTTPDGIFGVPEDNTLHLGPGTYARIAGSTGQSSASYRLVKRTDVFFLAPYAYLQTPKRTGTLWLLGSQPLNGNVTLFAEGLWHERHSAQRTAPAPIISGLSPLPTLSDGTQGVPAGNWYNPFGVDISVIRRRLVELPDRNFEQHIEAWRALLGARGSWGAWHWEIAGASAGAASRSAETGLPSALRLIPALGPSGPDAAGHIVCGLRDAGTGIVPPENVIAGCVPLDLFDGAGSITPEQVKYINADLHDRGGGSSRLLDFSAEGPWGALPAGAVRWAIGAEYLREGGNYRLDPLRKAGVSGEGIPAELTGASFAAHEIYVEGRAPLLKDEVAVRALDLAFGVRHSRYSSFGGDTTWQAGLRWQPLAAWTLRASHALVFRAPSLSELYGSQNLELTQGPDPCGNPTPTQRMNCAAHGVPGGAYVQDPLMEWNQLSGGNPRLAPERGNTFDAGLELQPVRVPGLRVSLDYFNVDLDEFIEEPGTEDVLLECANRGSPSVCALIHRAGDGRLLQVDILQRNLGRTVASGYDAAAEYQLKIRGMQMQIGAGASYLARRDSEFFRGEEPQRVAGMSQFPRWRANSHLDVSASRWRMSYSLQFIGVQTQCSSELGDPPQTVCFPIGSVLYHDLEGALQPLPRLELRAGILNLTDCDPPYIDGGGPNTDVGTYRLLGRTYYAAVEYRF